MTDLVEDLGARLSLLLVLLGLLLRVVPATRRWAPRHRRLSGSRRARRPAPGSGHARPRNAAEWSSRAEEVV